MRLERGVHSEAWQGTPPGLATTVKFSPLLRIGTGGAVEAAANDAARIEKVWTSRKWRAMQTSMIILFILFCSGATAR